MPDVVIVGGGPVGLWVAIQVKKWQPGFSVVVLEKNQQYSRSHVLRLEGLSTKLYASPTNDQPTKDFYQHIGGQGNLTIPTMDLEASLKLWAKVLGVEIQYREASAPYQVEEWFPDCRYFVAADGAHSKMRRTLFGVDSQALNSQTMQCCVELKYRVVGPTKQLDLWNEQRRLNAKLTSMATEHVGREFGGQTSITIRFFVDQATFNAMPECGFKNPLGLDDTGIPGPLLADIRDYLAARQEKTAELILVNSIKITKLSLAIYTAKKFGIERKATGAPAQGSRWWFLAGDAAMGLPYFRSLNAGLIVGSQLAAILAQKMMSGPVKLAAYEAVKIPDQAVESVLAHLKNAGLNVLNGLRKFKIEW